MRLFITRISIALLLLVISLTGYIYISETDIAGPKAQREQELASKDITGPKAETEQALTSKYIAGPKAETEQALTSKDIAEPKAKTEQALPSKIRILCWVMTSPQNLDKKAQHIKKTWGKRFDVFLFMSSVSNDTFPSIGLNVSEGRSHLTAKTMLAFRHVYENYLDEADWFMKADDDTYVIVENLRYFLSDKNTNDPIFFGHHFVTNVKQGYFSGGAGYVISKEALRRFGKVKTGTSFCKKDGGSEDVEFARCMEYLGVKTGSSIDAKGNSRFHCFDTLTHLRGGYPQWYYNYDEFGAKKMPSDYTISFHYVSVKNMYLLDFLIYHLKPYGFQSYYPNESFTNTTLRSRR